MPVLTLKPAVTTVRGSDLPCDDNQPLETSLHYEAMLVLDLTLRHYWKDQADVYMGSNMFVYFDPHQDKRHHYRGPDFFVVKGVKDKYRPRDAWVIWEEGGLAPNLVVELASTTTAKTDLKEKKTIYEKQLKTPEYLIYNPRTKTVQGWRLVRGRYLEIKPNTKGWLWCEELGLWLGVADCYSERYFTWLPAPRFFDEDGQLVLTEGEDYAQRAMTEAQARHQAEISFWKERQARQNAERSVQMERQRVETMEQSLQMERQRVEKEIQAHRALEEEIARLKAQLQK